MEVFASGRINLIGDHIDYSGGPVLPFALPLGTTIRGERWDRVEATSASERGRAVVEKGGRGRGWGKYLAAAWLEVRRVRPGVGGWRGAVSSTLPIGAGLSSSASLLVASFRLWNGLYGLGLKPEEMARMAWDAEVKHLGKPVGPMDPYAIALAEPGCALLFDCARLTGRRVPLPPASWVAVHSGVKRALARSGYARRRRECESAARELGLEMLADATPRDLGRLAGVSLRRARHVVTECARVADAVRAVRSGDLASLGRLFTRSHASLRDDFDVSVPEVDALVNSAFAAGASGARMVGGGFGGTVLALWEPGDPRAERFARSRRAIWSEIAKKKPRRVAARS